MLRLSSLEGSAFAVRLDGVDHVEPGVELPAGRPLHARLELLHAELAGHGPAVMRISR
jgi:hypothetical protein